MGEISFNYLINPEAVNETAFRYWFSESTEYSFAYQRYVALSDASIFNNPVAITKVATGLSRLHDLFADRTVYLFSYQNLLAGFKNLRNTLEDSYHAESNKSRIDVNANNQLQESYVSDECNTVINENKTLDKNRISFEIYDDNIQVSGQLKISVLDGKNYGFSRNHYLDLYRNLLLKNSATYNNLEMYQNLQVCPDTKRFQILQNIKVAPILDFEISIYEQLLLELREKALNTTGHYFLSSGDFNGQILESIYTKLNDNAFLSYIDNVSLRKDKLQAGMTNYLFGRLPNKIGLINDVINGKTRKKENSINASYSLSTDTNRYANTFGHLSLSKSNLVLNRDNVLFGKTDDKIGLYQQQYHIFKSDKIANINPTIPLYYSSDRYCTIHDGKLLIPEMPHTSIFDVVYQSFKNTKQGFTLDDFVLAKDNVHVSMQYSDWFLTTSHDTADIIAQTLFCSKEKYNLSMNNTDIFVDLDDKSFVLGEKNIHAYKDSKEINESQRELFLSQIKKSTELTNTILGFNKYNNYSMSIYDSNVFANKQPQSMVIINALWAKNLPEGIQILNNPFFANKEAHDVAIFRQGQALIKSLISITLDDFDFVIKYYIPDDVIDIIVPERTHKIFTSMIIPVSKAKHHTYIDNINRMVQKLAKEGFITQDDMASVIPHNASLPNIELVCDAVPHKVYIEYKNIGIAKSKLRTMIEQDFFVKKEGASTTLFKTEIADAIDKVRHKIWIDKEIHIQKKRLGVSINDDIEFTKESKEIYCNNSLFVDKLSQMCYYDYNSTCTDRERLGVQIDSQFTSAERTPYNMNTLDCITPGIKEGLGTTFYEYDVFGSTFIKQSGLFKEMESIQRTHYDLGIQPDDFGNWAWVYETPDPFTEGMFGIDELLLPENDTKYENFEDIIFDRQNMVPRNPIKVIDENTFVAKYPIRHPIQKYSETGIDYDKGAIKFENFYGVETGVMHEVFLKFYRIWQNKIFEFGTMTMTQSLEKMLDYLHAWIMTYFPLEQIEQALRVFRLIRWYGETSIIQNSQYIVSYEYETLTSMLTTGTCLIPNDLATNNTMYIDATLGVIRNNPNLLGNDAYVTFEINNRKNTTFTFSLSNTVGSVNIYVNNTLIDTVSRSALNLTYELPYTGDTNIVKIEKTASNNLNASFYIGNIKIPNCTFKNLSIEFDPTLKAGNKPLNDIAKKMIAYANLHEDREEIYTLLREGNLGIGETYKKLEEYWNLHHQNKTKGKRLTIKEV